jgi:uncharacterized repeat protein (TIGR02543 family)
MTMLLNWNESDPVSQKEIDRNNAIYNDYQHNRNPFIDHPEYARLIWDENYQGGSAYTIACAQNIQHGSISAPATAVEGTTVNLSATPDMGYMLDSWDVYKTGEPSTKVFVTNSSFVMPSYDVTVSATFTENTTQYAITYATGLSHGSVSGPSSSLSGATVTLSNMPDNGYSLYSYYVYETGNINNIVYSGSGSTFTMPAYPVTVSASFGQNSSNAGDYVKVTSEPSDWTGEYLIVYEVGSKAFNGALTGLDGTPNSIDVTIADGTIASNNTTNSAKFTITKSGNAYTIKSASGYYIGRTTDGNGLDFSTGQAYTNTLTFNNGDVDVVSSGGAYLRFNHTNNQQKFRYFKSATYGNMKPIHLYKKTSGIIAPTHTIYFNSNGGSGTMNNQSVNENEPTALTANAFTRSGYAFSGWNTAANGSGTYYADQATVTLLNDLTLYAQWGLMYSITCETVEHGSISASVNMAAEGEVVSLMAFPDSGFDLLYWVVTDANDEPVEVVSNQFVMPGCAVTVSAVFGPYVETYKQQYYLVTSTDHLINGRTYLIVNSGVRDAAKAMAGQSGNNRSTADVDIDLEEGWPYIASIENTTACELTLGAEGNNWSFYDASYVYNGGTGGYLYASSGSNNQLKTQTTLDDNGRWAITIDGTTGVATIVAQGNNTRNNIKYNPNGGNPIFSCYASNATGVVDVYLFIKGQEFDHTQSGSITQLLPSDKHTVYAGATLTVTGSAVSGNVSHVVLEEGAQLYHGGGSVKATLKKSITAYSGTGGWYTMAVPFVSCDPASVVGMTEGNYDLYAYDEGGTHDGKEWVNYKPNGNFNLVAGSGYLYANGTSQTLRLGGSLNSGAYSMSVDLGYSGNTALKGFNLLGNPVAHDITFTKSSQVSDGYYYLNHGGSWTYANSNSVPVGRGILVKANAANQTVTLNPQTKRGGSPEEDQYLCLSVGDEKAYVKLNEGVSMPLLDMNGQHSSLYLQSEHEPYIMLVRDGAETLDLCYEAHGNGTQTLKVDTDGLGLNSLHLIDNKTGADVDLLATSSYQFEAKEGDYATRFRLVFGPSTGSGTEGSTSFAYYADGEIRLTEPCQGASLQIVDMTGRVVATRSGRIQCVPTSGMTPGVYVLRLVTADGVRVQKMVVR